MSPSTDTTAELPSRAEAEFAFRAILAALPPGVWETATRSQRLEYARYALRAVAHFVNGLEHTPAHGGPPYPGV